MKRTNNYLIMRDQAKSYFLNFDQQMLAERWNLPMDGQTLYVSFFEQPYRIDRKSGSVFRLETGEEAGFEEVLSIFDLLCYPKSRPQVRPEFAPVNSLDGKPAGAGVSTSGTFDSYAAAFGKDADAFCRACEALHGIRVPIGDIGYEFTVFADLKMRLKFYEADEEFPPQLTVLFHANALSYARYETIFYIMNFQMDQIVEEMKRGENF